jgi:1,4-dihydroxy-2-naphthoate octaprenyltransferase
MEGSSSGQEGGGGRRFDPRRARELLGGERAPRSPRSAPRETTPAPAHEPPVEPELEAEVEAEVDPQPEPERRPRGSGRSAARQARELSDSVRIWTMAARPRTLPAAVAPVLVGTALARHDGDVNWLAFFAALVGAVAIQVGTNLSNDYSDARRGADAEDRLGPVRVTAGGLVPPRQVLIATWASFGVAVLVGIYLIAIAGWQLLVIGAASILAGVLYTGGPRPYGYEGLGELFVFLFFGLVAVTGSYFVQREHVTWEAVALAVPVGMLAASILVVNNVRDIDTDRRAGKRTLVVRLGRHRARNLYAALVYPAFLLPPLIWLAGGSGLTAWLLLPWLALPLAVPVVRIVRNRTDGPSLNDALARTGMVQLAFCVLLSAALLLS